MPHHKRVAVLGFTSFERKQIETQLRHAAALVPDYELCEVAADADLLLADADDPVLLDSLLRRDLLRRTLVLGAAPQPQAARQLARPFNLALVLKTLDQMCLQPAASEPAPSAGVQRVLSQLAALTTAAPSCLDEVLLVDADPSTLRFLSAQLERFGYQVHLVRSGLEAVQRVARRDFAYVFVAVGLDGMDGFQTCVAIKQAAYAAPRAAPAVVLLTRRSMPSDRVRGASAGCDAWLDQPPRADELLALVGARSSGRGAFVDTAQATTLY